MTIIILSFLLSSVGLALLSFSISPAELYAVVASLAFFYLKTKCKHTENRDFECVCAPQVHPEAGGAQRGDGESWGRGEISHPAVQRERSGCGGQ